MDNLVWQLKWHETELSNAEALATHAEQLRESVFKDLVELDRKRSGALAAAIARKEIAHDQTLPFMQQMEVLRKVSSTYNAWFMMAIRDGAFTLCHFKDVLPVIKKELDADSEIARKFDDVVASFHAAFPDIKLVRDSYGHSGQNLADDDARSGHTIDEPFDDGLIKSEGTNAFMQGNVNGRTTTSTHRGKKVSYQLSKDTLAILKKITAEAEAVLAPLCVFSRR